MPRTHVVLDMGETLAFECTLARRSFGARRSLWLFGVLPSPPVASRALLRLLPAEFADKPELAACLQGWVQLGLFLMILLGRGPQGGPPETRETSQVEGITQELGGGE